MNRHTLQIIVIIAIFFISVRGVSQTHVYLDENGKEISIQEFKKKCNSNYIYKCLSYTKEGIVLFKIFYKHQFGKLDPYEYDQIRKLIIKDAQLTIEPNQIIILKKFDSLYSYERELTLHKTHERERKRINVKTDSLNKVNGTDIKSPMHEHNFNREIFEKNLKLFEKKLSECKDEYEKKYNVKVIYMHQDNQALEKNYENLMWLKDRGIIKNIFFKSNNVHHSLILKPDGEYFLIGSHFKSKYLKRLLKNDDWSTFKKKFKASLTSDYPEGKGIFKKDKNLYHYNHCF